MSDTGETVFQDSGEIGACLTLQSLCAFACCHFTQGNWIMLLPGELELAKQQGLKLEHLQLENNWRATCHRPCKAGDFKPFDCSWYPLFPANCQATKFLVADHRKCPIPNFELIDKMLSVHESVLAWEKRNPGALVQLVDLSRNFVGYMPFPYKIKKGSVAVMDQSEMRELELTNKLPENYRCEQWTEIKWGYNATSTPDE